MRKLNVLVGKRYLLAVALVVLLLSLGGCGGEKGDPVMTAKQVIGENFKALAEQYKLTGKDSKSFEHEGQHYTLTLFDKRGNQALSFLEEDGRPREKVLEFDGGKVKVVFTHVGRIQFDLVDE